MRVVPESLSTGSSSEELASAITEADDASAYYSTGDRSDNASMIASVISNATFVNVPGASATASSSSAVSSENLSFHPSMLSSSVMSIDTFSGSGVVESESRESDVDNETNTTDRTASSSTSSNVSNSTVSDVSTIQTSIADGTLSSLTASHVTKAGVDSSIFSYFPGDETTTGSEEPSSRHPSASFLNVGSRMRSDPASATPHDADAAAALALARRETLDSSAAASDDDGDVFPMRLFPPPPSNDSSAPSLREEYTCCLCGHLIVGACVLDCASGGSHSFCALCVERHASGLGTEKEDGWLVLQRRELYPTKPGEVEEERRRGATRSRDALRCPDCGHVYTQAIPCRSLDVAIRDFVTTGAVDKATKEDYQRRCTLWSNVVEDKRRELEHRTVEEQRRIMELCKSRQEWEPWRKIIATTTTTVAMIALSVFAGASGNRRR